MAVASAEPQEWRPERDAAIASANAITSAPVEAYTLRSTAPAAMPVESGTNCFNSAARIGSAATGPASVTKPIASLPRVARTVRHHGGRCAAGSTSRHPVASSGNLKKVSARIAGSTVAEPHALLDDDASADLAHEQDEEPAREHGQRERPRSAAIHRDHRVSTSLAGVSLSTQSTSSHHRGRNEMNSGTPVRSPSTA